MNKNQKRILIVDDEPFILRSLTRILEDDYDITTAPGGREALELLKNNEKFDLIISDVSMPDMNGAELYKTIAIQFPGLEKNILFMTGFAYTDELKKFLIHIPNTVLPKPFEQVELYETLRNFFNKHD